MFSTFPPLFCCLSTRGPDAFLFSSSKFEVSLHFWRSWPTVWPIIMQAPNQPVIDYCTVSYCALVCSAWVHMYKGAFTYENQIFRLLHLIFWEELFGRIFLGGIFGRNSLFTFLVHLSYLNIEYERNWCFCQDFGVMQGRTRI